MADSVSGGIKLSNLALIALITALGAGILLDGTLYNKPALKQAIYALDKPSIVEIHFDDQLVFGFAKFDHKWQQTTPVIAPAHQKRIQVLLDTNKYAQRTYASTALPVDDIFHESITLKLNNSHYEFGTIEPVSKLRYVRANNQVYLQPDTVIPLLSAANNAFIDLKITDQVQSVTIGDTKLTALEPWSNLTAIDVTVQPDIKNSREQGLEITLIQNGDSQNFNAHRTNTGFILSSPNGFDYLITEKIGEALGLADLIGSTNQ